jgi:hypothetical protein
MAMRSFDTGNIHPLAGKERAGPFNPGVAIQGRIERLFV